MHATSTWGTRTARGGYPPRISTSLRYTYFLNVAPGEHAANMRQGDPGHEEPARQAAPIPEAHHCSYHPREGYRKRMPGERRHDSGETRAAT